MRLGRIKGYSSADFDMVKDQGLSFIEICTNNQSEAEHFLASANNIKKEIERTGIDVSCVGRWNHDINVGGYVHEDRMKVYLAQIDAAIDLGAKTYVCGINKDDSVSLYKNYSCAIELFGRLLERADGRINIAVENCDWNNFIVSPRDWEIVLGELPGLKIKYDCSHAYNRGDNYLDELSDWGERIAHFHVKGTTHAGTRWVDDPPAGMDDIKWGSVFSILYARGYNGDLSIEPHSRTWHGELGDAGVAFTQKYISQFIL